MDQRNFLFAHAGQTLVAAGTVCQNPPLTNVQWRPGNFEKDSELEKKKKKEIHRGHVTDHKMALGMEQEEVFFLNEFPL